MTNQYGGFDILRIDDSFYDGFSLVNPEGEIFHEVKYCDRILSRDGRIYYRKQKSW